MPQTPHSVARLTAHVKKLTQQSLPAGSLDFFAAGHRVGVMLPEMVSSLRAHPEFIQAFAFENSRVCLKAPAGTEEAVMADRARRLHDAGLFFQWRDELLDVFDLDTGEKLFKAERGAFRFFGMETRAVYAVGSRSDGNIFICRRSPAKQIDPDLWDALAAGMIAADESPEESLAREIDEEAGLTSGYIFESDWVEIAVRRVVEEGWMHENAIARLVRVADGVTPVNKDGEVSEIRTVGKEELLDLIGCGQTPADTALVFLTTLFGTKESL